MVDERYVNIDGISTRYVVEGRGSPVLLIHGFGEFLEVWGYNISPLSGHFTVYALDLPGHGLSEEPRADYTLDYAARFVADFMKTLEIERASLVGHSLGGLLCLKVAIDFPEKVNKLVLVDSAGLSKEAPLIYRLATLPVLGKAILKPTLKTVIKHGMKKGFYNPEIIARDWVDLSYKYLKMPKLKRTLWNLIRNNASIDGLNPELIVTDKLRMIKSPTLIIHGAQDEVIPVEYARLACKLIPNVRCEVIDECGHCPQIEKAAQFNDLVAAFLRASESAEKGAKR
jgi:4,5:9,10-diseco-3-hydroxy-5,9,17-trioxoandrosta-1(10),2-diene-4-oate hydrolase